MRELTEGRGKPNQQEVVAVKTVKKHTGTGPPVQPGLVRYCQWLIPVYSLQTLQKLQRASKLQYSIFNSILESDV
jgi:hypothetical protein